MKSESLPPLKMSIVTSSSQKISLGLYAARTRQMFEDKVKNSEELLRRRELALKTVEATHDQTLKSELSR